MTLPVLAVIFEHFYRDDRATTTPWEKISRYAPMWAMAAIYFGVRSIVMGGVTSIVLRPNLSWYGAGLSGVALVGQYLGKLIWPAHLSAFYVFHPSRHLTDAAVLLGLAGLAVCTSVFVALWRRAQLLTFALLWIFVTLAPVLNSADIPNLVAVSGSNPDAPIDLMVKARGQTLYLFAAISGPGTANGGFLVEGMSGNGVATVLGENRSVAVTGGSFGDAFAANDVHIYELDLTAVTCD